MVLNCWKLKVMAAIGLVVPQLALARLDPVPPPSGIVIHLFGPGSVMDQMVPQEAAPPAPQGQNSAAAKLPPPASYREPNIEDVFHQMFVTGDPNDPPKPSAGRTADRP